MDASETFFDSKSFISSSFPSSFDFPRDPKDRITIKEEKTGKGKNFPKQVLLKSYNGIFGKSQFPIRSTSISSTERSKQPIKRQQAHKIIKDVTIMERLQGRFGTHTLRKTFAYHAYQSGIDISILQKLFNHSAPFVTLAYIGITQDELTMSI